MTSRVLVTSLIAVAVSAQTVPLANVMQPGAAGIGGRMKSYNAHNALWTGDYHEGAKSAGVIRWGNRSFDPVTVTFTSVTAAAWRTANSIPAQCSLGQLTIDEFGHGMMLVQSDINTSGVSGDCATNATNPGDGTGYDLWAGQIYNDTTTWARIKRHGDTCVAMTDIRNAICTAYYTSAGGFLDPIYAQENNSWIITEHVNSKFCGGCVTGNVTNHSQWYNERLTMNWTNPPTIATEADENPMDDWRTTQNGGARQILGCDNYIKCASLHVSSGVTSVICSADGIDYTSLTGIANSCDAVGGDKSHAGTIVYNAASPTVFATKSDPCLTPTGRNPCNYQEFGVWFAENYALIFWNGSCPYSLIDILPQINECAEMAALDLTTKAVFPLTDFVLPHGKLAGAYGTGSGIGGCSFMSYNRIDNVTMCDGRFTGTADTNLFIDWRYIGNPSLATFSFDGQTSAEGQFVAN